MKLESVLIGFFLVFGSGAEAAKYYVKQNALGNQSGLSWQDAFHTLDDALEVARSGDRVWVAQGIYSPARAININSGESDSDLRASVFWMRAGVKLYGGFRGNEERLSDRRSGARTTLSGRLSDTDHAYHVLFYDARAGLTQTFGLIDGFTIEGGRARGLRTFDRNGAGLIVWDSSSTSFSSSRLDIENVVFQNNVAQRWGGGVYTQFSAVTFRNVIFQKNTARNGGGAFLENVTGLRRGFANCYFEGNHANSQGGAIFRTAGPVAIRGHQIANSVFVSNSAGNERNPESRGGAIFYDPKGAENVTRPWRIVNSLFVKNKAAQGGALWIAAGFDGGFFEVEEPNLFLINSTLVENRVWGNGGAVYLAQNGIEANLTVLNSILWQNEAPIDRDIHGRFEAERSLFEGAWDGNVFLDPGFVDPVGGNFRLRSDSPVLDFGLVELLAKDVFDLDNDEITDEDVPFDLDGELRYDPDELTLDIGAFEGVVENRRTAQSAR